MAVARRTPAAGAMVPALQSAPPPARSPEVARAIADPEWQKLWLTLSSLDWASLALIPASAGDSATQVAEVLLGLATDSHQIALRVLDLRKLTIKDIHQVEELFREVNAHRRTNPSSRAVVILSSPQENPTTTRIARQLDAAVLCVSLSESRIADADKAIEEIGRERFVGTIVLQRANDKKR